MHLIILAKIAYRNLREHRTKTLIIGSLIATGMLVLVVGNSVIDTATAGVRASYTANYTGHVIVAAGGVPLPMLTPDVNPEAYGRATPTIPDFDSAMAFIASQDGVRAVTPMITGLALTQANGEGFGLMQFYGIDPDRYRGFFPDNVELLAGEFLETGGRGLVISERTLEMLGDSLNREIGVGDRVLLTAPSEVHGLRIREVEIVGVFRFRSATMPLEFVSFLDAESARTLNGMTGLTNVEALLTPAEQAGLGAVDEDDLFGGDLFDVPAAAAASGEPFGGGSRSGGDETSPRVSGVDPDAWHYILVRLDDERQSRRAAGALNREFEAFGFDLVAFDWLDGAGQVASLTFALRTVFTVLVVLVAIVAVIIIMNTLVISVTERIAEVGTMRAIGAQKAFVRRMIVIETLMIAMVFGAIGIAAGAGITTVIGVVGIASDNQIAQVFMGGPTLNPVVSPGSVLSSLAAIAVAGVASSLYPVAVALRIEPVAAMHGK